MAKVVFTAGRVSAHKCAPDKAQAFLWDLTAPGLGLRDTPAGKPAYVFQSRYQDKTIRLTIGSPDAWSIEHARDKSKALQRLIDDGKDPRDLKRDALAEKANKAAAALAQAAVDTANALTVGDLWPRYLAEGRPKRRDAWKPGYRAVLREFGAEILGLDGEINRKRLGEIVFGVPGWGDFHSLCELLRSVLQRFVVEIVRRQLSFPFSDN